MPGEEPTDKEKARSATAATGRVDQIQTADPDTVTAFLTAWFGVEPDRQVPGVSRFLLRDTLIRVSRAEEPEHRWIPLGTADYNAAVERCAAAGFTITPSPTHPAVAGHIELGGHVFLLVELPRDDAYYAGLSTAVEAGDYRAAGPVELSEEHEK